MTRKKLIQERFALGELERDAERAAQFTPVGSIWQRCFLWIARKAKVLRQEVDDELKEPNP